MEKVNPNLKGYMFWEFLSIISIIIYLALFAIMIVTDAYILLLVGFIVLAIVPIASVYKMCYAFELYRGKTK
jgi:hypothetical protein